jgi:hypothetical protein
VIKYGSSGETLTSEFLGGDSGANACAFGEIAVIDPAFGVVIGPSHAGIRIANTDVRFGA